MTIEQANDAAAEAAVEYPCQIADKVAYCEICPISYYDPRCPYQMPRPCHHYQCQGPVQEET